MLNIYYAIMGNFELYDLINAVLRIVISFVVGVCIGWERKNHQQIVGIRTLLLICLSSTLLGLLSNYAAHDAGDPSRIAAAVITGIGFVGGGAIMHRGFNVKGVTTAAIIWATAAIGLSIGYGLFIPALLVFALILILLPVFQKIEIKYFPSDKIRLLSLEYAESHVDFEKVKECLVLHGLSIKEVSISDNVKSAVKKFEIYVFAPSEIDLFSLNEALKATGELLEFSFVV
ncbi:MAG: MgtC/SapB family protein [Treponema sp.]|nr:MgtC/SapB family protein [Treponema sp.]